MDLERLKAGLRINGFAVLNKYAPAKPGLSVAQSFGVIAEIPNLKKIQILKPNRQSKATPNTYSGNFGINEFPLHTDLAHWFIPPRYLILRCISGSQNTETYLVDSKKIVNHFGYAKLNQVLVKPRRPANHSGFLLSILNTNDQEMLFRWDSLFIEPATESSKEVYMEIYKILSFVKRSGIVLRSRGDTLIIDNWRMLHGRSAVTRNDKSRRIERFYLKVLK